MTEPGFAYVVDEATSWPPQGRPKPPYGPSGIEVLRSCALRNCFDTSSGYEQRMGFAARVGTAFHETLQSLNENPPQGASAEDIAEDARQRFWREMRLQEAEANARPRERGLARDLQRTERAAEAVVIEALRISREGHAAVHSGADSLGGRAENRGATGLASGAANQNRNGSLPAAEVEVPVNSANGLLVGRIDRVEHGPMGTRLLDYKSALRDDLPDRYERQLQLYALMWHDTRGDWPTQANVIYPLAASAHMVDVNPEVCQQVAAESAAIAARVQKETNVGKLATPGDVCRVCEYRPWCKPFWRWQAGETSLSAALGRAEMGFEGTIRSSQLLNFHWRVKIAWRNAEVQLLAPQERFPHLSKAGAGVRVRVLDTALRGLRFQPQAAVTETSEVFLMCDSSEA